MTLQPLRLNEPPKVMVHKAPRDSFPEDKNPNFSSKLTQSIKVNKLGSEDKGKTPKFLWSNDQRSRMLAQSDTAPKTGYAPAPKTGYAPAQKTGYAPAPKTGSAPAPKTGYAPAQKTGYASAPKTGSASAQETGYAPAPKTGYALAPETDSSVGQKPDSSVSTKARLQRRLPASASNVGLQRRPKPDSHVNAETRVWVALRSSKGSQPQRLYLCLRGIIIASTAPSQRHHYGPIGSLPQQHVGGGPHPNIVKS